MNYFASAKKHRTWIVPFAFLFVAMLLWIGSVSAYALSGVDANKVYNVDQAMTSYNSIQAAVDAADPGDTLVVGPGTYTESVVIDVENLTLMSNEGAATTMIDGGVTGVEVYVDQFSLAGFTIEASEYTVNLNSRENGNIEISDCILKNAMYGILVDNLTDTTIDLSGNAMSTTWRGFYFSGTVTESEIMIQDNSFENIQANGGVYFHKNVIDSNVEISGNTFLHCSEGVYFFSDIQDTTVTISYNDFEEGSTGVYTSYYYDSGTGTYGYGIWGTSEFTVSNNTFDELDDEAIYVDYLDFGAVANIFDNEIQYCWEGISVDYVSYEDPDQPASAFIEGNQISDCYYGIYFDSIDYGSVLVQDNTILNTSYGIYIEYCADYGEETDVQILNNSITATSETTSLDYGIYIYEAESYLTISGNTIRGIEEDYLYDYGVYIEYLGEEGAEPAMVDLCDNTISFCESAIYFYSPSYDFPSEILISGNDISDSDYGIYMDNLTDYSTTLDITANWIEDCGYGIYLEDVIDYGSETIAIWIGNNWIADNTTGIYLYYVRLSFIDSSIIMTENDIVGNTHGIRFYDMSDTSPDFVRVSCNNISGNSVYGINNEDPDFLVEAGKNWWGDATGPNDGENDALGDMINGNVEYDPWIAGLVLTPGTSVGKVAANQTFVATVIDNHGNKADVCLKILFTVSGINGFTKLVSVVDGVATLAYSGGLVGVDEVNAGLVFSSDPAEGLVENALANWTASTTAPDTGDSSNDIFIYLLMMVLALMAGTRLLLATKNK